MHKDSHVSSVQLIQFVLQPSTDCTLYLPRLKFFYEINHCSDITLSLEIVEVWQRGDIKCSSVGVLALLNKRAHVGL